MILRGSRRQGSSIIGISAGSVKPNLFAKKTLQGLMQLMPDTAARFGVEKAFVPEENIEGGVLYLKYLLKLFKSNTQLAVAAYNADENRVKWMNAIPDFVETQNYVRKVLALYQREIRYIPYTAFNAPRLKTFRKN